MLLDHDVLGIIQDCLYRNNPYVEIYRTACKRLRQQQVTEHLAFCLHYDPNRDHQRYNLPTAAAVNASLTAPAEAVTEVSVILPGNNEDMDGGSHCDIIVQYQGGSLRCISKLHPSYTPLSYPLTHPRGEHGWHMGIQLAIQRHQMHHNNNEEEEDDNKDQGGNDMTCVTQL